MTRYGLYGEHSRTLLTYGGRIVFHTNRAELEFLCPFTRIVEVPKDIPEGQTLHISHHPRYEGISFPLRREEFR